MVGDTSDAGIIQGEIGRALDGGLTPFLQSTMRSCEFPGLAVGVVVDGEIAYAKGFGVRSIETGEPVSMTTLFHLASISKPFVATALVQLVERGRVRLDAPIVAYLPTLQLDDGRYREITVQQMLSHVSGMPDVEDYEWEKPQYDEGALERYVRSLSSKKLIAEPGARYAYSNMAFECLGNVIAKVLGMPFDDYVKTHILNPAGMVESTFLKPEHLPANWAAPHVRMLANVAWEGYPYNRQHGPSSTLHSNALEMCYWAITSLNRGSFRGRQILSPSSYDLLWKPWAETDYGEHVGLSWFLAEHRGERTVEHGGGDTGFRAHLVMLPDKRAAAVVLCNVSPAPAHKIPYSILDVLLGYEPGPIVPYASLLVCKTLAEEGLEAAVAQWESLKSDHPDEYDLGRSQFYSLVDAVSLGWVQDAERLAVLCARILPEADLQDLEKGIEGFQNEAATAVLTALHEHR